MNNLRKRIERLEGYSQGSVTVIIYVPPVWSDGQRDQAVERLLHERDLPESFETMVPSISDTTEARIAWVGDLTDLFASIAERGNRVTDKIPR